jgi:senataxin
MSRIVKLVEKYSSTLSDLERCNIIQRASECEGKHNMSAMDSIRGELETHILDSVHIVLTTLGTAGSKALEQAAKFEVVVIDEAAQSVEPSSLTALQLGSKHCILVGDPQQLPATIFSVSGKSTKFDRSLFQRLEEAGHPFYMLKVQYRMHPKISYFPRNIFYGGSLVDGPNVEHPEYGNPLRRSICTHFDGFEVCSFYFFMLSNI